MGGFPRMRSGRLETGGPRGAVRVGVTPRDPWHGSRGAAVLGGSAAEGRQVGPLAHRHRRGTERGFRRVGWVPFGVSP